MTNQEPANLSHWAGHCISNLCSSKRLASVEPNEQLVYLFLFVGNYVHYRQWVIVENVGNLRVVFRQIRVPESGKFQLRIWLKKELVVENEVGIKEVKHCFQALLPVDNRIW